MDIDVILERKSRVLKEERTAKVMVIYHFGDGLFSSWTDGTISMLVVGVCLFLLFGLLFLQLRRLLLRF